jgi:hypothetical protein
LLSLEVVVAVELLVVEVELEVIENQVVLLQVLIQFLL